MIDGPFEHHIREAIALNRARAPLYAALSNGESRSVSRLLIAAEWLLLPVARWFDRKAAPYHRAGVPLLDVLLVSMGDVPPFGSVTVATEDTLRRVSPAPAGIRRNVERAYRDGSFPEAAAAIARELNRLTPAGGNYLLVHLLESAHRLAALAPGAISRSRECGLASPEPLLARLLRLHLLGLAPASLLDVRAAPLHARGIPILAQDLPPIPLTRPEPRS